MLRAPVQDGDPWGRMGVDRRLMEESKDPSTDSGL